VALAHSMAAVPASIRACGGQVCGASWPLGRALVRQGKGERPGGPTSTRLPVGHRGGSAGPSRAPGSPSPLLIFEALLTSASWATRVRTVIAKASRMRSASLSSLIPIVSPASLAIRNARRKPFLGGSEYKRLAGQRLPNAGVNRIRALREERANLRPKGATAFTVKQVAARVGVSE
jgi:hypothetical protein